MICEVFNELLAGDVLNGSYVSVDKRKVLLCLERPDRGLVRRDKLDLCERGGSRYLPPWLHFY